MGIYNINTIQKNIDLINSSYTNEYLLQSLANLGQRLSVKGDSVEISSFNFSDIFISNNNYDPTEFIGEINVDENNEVLQFKIFNRNNLQSPVETLSHSFINKYLNIKEQIKLDVPINDIAYYDHVIIRTTQYNFNVILYGYKQNNGVDVLSEICVYDFNKYSGLIDEAIKINIDSLNSGNENVSSVLYHIKQNDSNNDYILKIYGYNGLRDHLINTINTFHDTIDNNNLSTSFVLDSLISTTSNFKIFNISTYSISNENTTLYYSNNIFTVSNELLKNKLLGQISSSIKTDIENFNNDLLYLFSFVKTYYSDTIYLNTKSDLYKQIILELYNCITSYNSKMYNIVYIPVNFKFNFYCNSNNTYKIYNSVEDILVKYIAVENEIFTEAILDEYYDNSCLITSTDTCNRNILYNYSVEYDSYDNKENIYGINVYKKYSLPYINKDNVWVINDIETEIRAKGLDAGNPNIMIIYNKSQSNNGYEILASANKTNIIDKISFKLKQTFINPIYNYNKSDKSIFTNDNFDVAHCWVPDIKKLDLITKNEYIEQLKYMFIISISSLNCITINNNISQTVYKDSGVITTFWAYDETISDFDVIKSPDIKYDNMSPALDLVTLSNVKNIADFFTKNIENKEPDYYTHDWLVFDKSYITVKNTTLNTQKNIYCTLANYKGTYITKNKMNYDNDLNFVIKYIDEINGANEHNIQSINYYDQQYKYIIFNNDKIATTNALYTYRTQGNVTNNYLEFIPNDNVPVFNTKEILLQNTNVLNRLNILSLSNFNEYGYIYNGYIGTSFEDKDKYKFRIGTSKVNVNLGTDTLIYNDYTGTNGKDKSKLKTHTELHLDFEHTYINGKLDCAFDLVTKNIYSYGDKYNIYQPIKNLNNVTKDIERYEIKNTLFTPISKYILVNDNENNYIGDLSALQLNNTIKRQFRINNNYKELEISVKQLNDYYIYADMLKNLSDTYPVDIKLWTPLFFVFNSEQIQGTNTVMGTPTQSLFYIGDGLFIPALLRRLKLNDFYPENIKTNKYSINVSSNLDIITMNNYPLFLITKNKFLTNINYINSSYLDNYSKQDELNNYNYVDTNGINNAFYLLPSNVLIGNDLSITYYIEGKGTNYENLNITINECNSDQTILLPFKLNCNYTII